MALTIQGPGPAALNPLFGAFDVRLDGWDVEYGAEMRADFGVPVEPDESIDLDVEHPAAGWAPVEPAVTTVPRTIVFIDGVRRLEARLLVRSGEVTCYGAFGSYGVGAVLAEPGCEARFTEAVIGRHLIFGSGQLPEWPVHLGTALDYLPLSTPDAEPDGPLCALQYSMRQAEATMAWTSDQPWVTVCDGPLQPMSHAPARESLRPDQDVRSSPAVVGLIKRVYKLYLPQSHRSVLDRLGPSQRTPVFRIGTADARARYSWFLRLAVPGPAESELTGLVRLEVSAAIGIQQARLLADETATRLPGFVPSRARDPRAPQNLLPIGALEQHLRHQLGDPRLIRRKIGELLAAPRHS
jgi:hypothetical protein